jgi:hypothetical protein
LSFKKDLSEEKMRQEQRGKLINIYNFIIYESNIIYNDMINEIKKYDNKNLEFLEKLNLVGNIVNDKNFDETLLEYYKEASHLIDNL